MEEENLTNYKLESKIDSNNVNPLVLHNSQIILLFNLYNNRLIHEKFLEQLFENLIENKQLVRYDFQKKIYSLYPNSTYFNFKIFNKFKILASLSTLCFLLRYIRYKKLIFDNLVFLKIYLDTISQLFNSKISLLSLLLQKRFRYLKIKLYRTFKSRKYILINLYKFILFNCLYCNFLMKENLSYESYKRFYQLKSN